MIESPFTVRNISRIVARHRKDDSKDLKAEYDLAARKILEKIESGTVFHEATEKFLINNKTVLSYTTEDATVASSLIVRNLEINARIKQPNRNEIVSALISSAAAKTECNT
ncbi:hypothetical protein GHO26_27245 [Pseudomonas helleri]|uniref:hypothetical protein n=1 Tax=Pseudomonas helleri TaxID=1608996 RepID=UPI00129678AC|nr:hypothetical protein [Pseudomonas helleri]MQU61417.1 hypothetical protein [Pseudomonas helleri]